MFCQIYEYYTTTSTGWYPILLSSFNSLFTEIHLPFSHSYATFISIFTKFKTMWRFHLRLLLIYTKCIFWLLSADFGSSFLRADAIMVKDKLHRWVIIWKGIFEGRRDDHERGLDSNIWYTSFSKGTSWIFMLIGKRGRGECMRCLERYLAS
jgi:hypothetical protein